MGLELPITIRKMTADDAPIVYDSWSRSMADELGIEDQDERRRFVRGQKPIIDSLLQRGHAFVACARKDEREVMGWCCIERPDILHFIFVKKPYRGGKVARRLIEHTGLPKVSRASHATSWGLPRVSRLFTDLSHHPELGAP